MNFFDAQDQARRATRRLVVVYLLATALIVTGVTAIVGATLYFSQLEYGVPAGNFMQAYAPLLAGVAVVTVLFIAGATLFKTAVLSSGGGRVAQQLGGTLVSPDVQDPLRQRLRNVVEEMSIASGVPVPEIYVLEQESGINAFAAGFAPEDAAVAVTRGAIELLDRDELQGVIAHEFSHILNGDMRLNIRMMGVLYGIMVLGLIGRMILRGGRYGAFTSSRRGRGAPAILIVGLGLAVLGGIGVFFARIIKAGVSRQREYLADASAVQFTRQTEGLAGALKKIGGFDAGSYLQAADPEEVSHMLFGTGARFSGLFATHPPLTERIQALEPNFDPGDYPTVDPLHRDITDRVAVDRGSVGGAAFVAAAGAATPAVLADQVGRPDDQQIDYAGWLRSSVPEVLYDAAHSSELGFLLALALILDQSGRVTERQLSLLHEQLGEQRTRLIRQYHDELSRTGAEYRLPVLEIAFPALRARPRPHLDYLVDLAKRLIEMDGQVSLSEFCFYRVLVASLQHTAAPARQPRRRRLARESVRRSALELLRIVAHYGHQDSDDDEAAFRNGIAFFGRWASDARYAATATISVAELDAHLDTLTALNADGRKLLVNAVGAVIMFDSQLTIVEAELMRAICATLECPLPPIITEHGGASRIRESRS